MERAPTRSKRIVLLWETKVLTVGRLTGARNERREEEDGGWEKKRENGAWPFFGRKEAQEGKERERKALKGSPQHKGKRPPSKGGLGSGHKAAMGQTRRLGDFLGESL